MPAGPPIPMQLLPGPAHLVFDEQKESWSLALDFRIKLRQDGCRELL